jgi:hypothetical protein
MLLIIFAKPFGPKPSINLMSPLDQKKEPMAFAGLVKT